MTTVEERIRLWEIELQTNQHGFKWAARLILARLRRIRRACSYAVEREGK